MGLSLGKLRNKDWVGCAYLDNACDFCCQNTDSAIEFHCDTHCDMKKIYLAGSKIGLCDWEEMPWREFVASEHPHVVDGTERKLKESKSRIREKRIEEENWEWHKDAARVKREVQECDAVIGYLDWSWGRPQGGYYLDWEMDMAKKAGKFVGLVDKRGECERGNGFWLDRADFFDARLYPVVLATLRGIGVEPKPDEWIIS